MLGRLLANLHLVINSADKFIFLFHFPTDAAPQFLSIFFSEPSDTVPEEDNLHLRTLQQCPIVRVSCAMQFSKQEIIRSSVRHFTV